MCHAPKCILCPDVDPHACKMPENDACFVANAAWRAMYSRPEEVKTWLHPLVSYFSTLTRIWDTLHASRGTICFIMNLNCVQVCAAWNVAKQSLTRSPLEPHFYPMRFQGSWRTTIGSAYMPNENVICHIAGVWPWTRWLIHLLEWHGAQ